MTTPPGPGDDRLDGGRDEILSERRRLIGLAYRLLGSLSDAEDVVQETYTRWYGLSPEQHAVIENPAAWLTTVASRICLDLLGSARVRRERYVGEWLPEPVPERSEAFGVQPGSAVPEDPADRVTLDESVHMAFLVVLDAMTPAERVAFILHDVFRYPFAEVAEIVGRTPAACRQLASSARRRVDTAHRRVAPRPQDAGLVHAFRQAWQAQDIAALVRILDPDAIAVADGGGRANAKPYPTQGGDRVARELVELIRGSTGDVTFQERDVNGRPGLVLLQHDRIAAVIAFDLAADRIARIWAITNPEKLRAWARR